MIDTPPNLGIQKSSSYSSLVLVLEKTILVRSEFSTFSNIKTSISKITGISVRTGTDSRTRDENEDEDD